MLFDTDLLIWVQKGNEAAAEMVMGSASRYLSIQSYMELIQTAPNKKKIKDVRGFLSDFNFILLPLTETIGHRASIYVEEYSMVHGIRSGDALIAATAMENNLMLASANAKHFKPIKDLQLKLFRP